MGLQGPCDFGGDATDASTSEKDDKGRGLANESEADKLGFDVVVVERAVDKFPVRVAVFRA